MRLSKANLLVVDDEPALCHLFKKWLGTQGCERVHTAPNGEVALDLIRSQPIDLLITDVSMPVMNGITLVRCMAKTKRVPSIVFMSGFGDVDKREMYALGVEAFLTKPFDHSELLRVLESSLDERSGLWLAEMATQPRQSMSIRVKELAGEAREDAICLGRGGFSAVCDLPLRPGKISFECLFEDGERRMAGQGYVRWSSRTDGTVGIEFAHLQECCHSWLTETIAESRPLSFIPAN